MTEPLVQLRSVSKAYISREGPRHVLEEVNLDVSPGERISLVGPNGSGKTTLLRIILGIEQPDEGSAILHGANTKRKTSYVPQDYRNALFPWLRLQSNLALANGVALSGSQLSGRRTLSSEAFQEYEELADYFRLSLDLSKYPYQLSGGEQQIFLLMRSVLSRPVLMLLDEPLSAVDFGRKRLIIQLLGRLIPERQITLISASHDFEESVLLADRVVIFARNSGRFKTIIPIDLPWPRTPEMRGEPRFRAFVEEITETVI